MTDPAGTPDPNAPPDPGTPDPQPASGNGTPDPAAELTAARAELEALKQRVGPLSDYLERADGSALAGGISNYLRLRQDPKIGPLIAKMEANGGVLPTGSDAGDDEYLTDEQKEIRSLRAQLNEVTGQLGEMNVSGGQQALERHMERFLGEYPLEPDEVAAVRAKLSKTFEDWNSAGEMGRNALRNIQNPKSYEKVEDMMIAAMPRKAMLDMGRRREERRRGHVEQFRTDPRGSAPNAGGKIPEFKGADAALKYLEYFEQNPHQIPNRH